MNITLPSLTSMLWYRYCSNHRDIKYHEKNKTVERIKVSYPKFKNGEATVRNIRVKPNIGKLHNSSLQIYKGMMQ